MNHTRVKLWRITAIAGLVLAAVVGLVPFRHRFVQAETVSFLPAHQPPQAQAYPTCPVEPIPLTPTLDTSHRPYASHPEDVTYVVQPGDTLYCIAQRHRTTGQAIALANDLAGPADIPAGKTLVIPYVQSTQMPLVHTGMTFGYDSGVGLLVLTYPLYVEPDTNDQVTVSIYMPREISALLPNPVEKTAVPARGVDLNATRSDQVPADCLPFLDGDETRGAYCAWVVVSGKVQVHFQASKLSPAPSEPQPARPVDIYQRDQSMTWLWEISSPPQSGPNHFSVQVYGYAESNPKLLTWYGFGWIEVLAPTPTPTWTATPTATSTATPTATSTATPTATSTATPTAAPVAFTPTPTTSIVARAGTVTPEPSPTVQATRWAFIEALAGYPGLLIGGVLVVLVLLGLGIWGRRTRPSAEPTPGVPASPPGEPEPAPEPGAVPPLRTVKVFISYAHEDEAAKDELLTQLAGARRRGVLDIWHDRRIEPGDEWYAEIRKAIEACEIALLLVSDDFIASRFIQDEELPRLLDRRAMQGDLRVLSIIVRHCLWAEEPRLSKRQVMPKNGIPVNSFSRENNERERVWAEIAQEIVRLAVQIRATRKPE